MSELLRTSVVSSATDWPVSVEDFKNHLRIEIGETHEDELLQAIVEAATLRVEEETGRKLMKQTHTVYFDEWTTGTCVEIPYPPLSSISTTTGFRYRDSTRGWNTLLGSSTGWVLDNVSEPGRVCLSYNANWPTGVTLFNVNPIAVTFVCGYSTVASGVPQRLRTAVKIIGASLYENREEVIVGYGAARAFEVPRTVRRLLADYRDWSF